MTDRCHTFGCIVKTKTEVIVMNPYEKCPVFEGEKFKLSKEVLIGLDDHKRYSDYYELKEQR